MSKSQGTDSAIKEESLLLRFNRNVTQPVLMLTGIMFWGVVANNYLLNDGNLTVANQDKVIKGDVPDCEAVKDTTVTIDGKTFDITCP